MRLTGFAIGTLLIFLGSLWPVELIIGLFRGDTSDSIVELWTGALLFKSALVLIGVYAVVLNFLPAGGKYDGFGNRLSPASRNQTLIFLAIVFGAALVRIPYLDRGIWYDEMLTHVKYMHLSIGQIVSTFDDANNHMLFSVLARTSLFIFGDSVWAFRLPAAVFGVGSVAAIYFLARRVTTTSQALFGAALLAVSFHHIWFSQNARGYTALLFFTIFSSSLFLDALHRNDRWRWGAYSFVAFLGAVTHLTMGFVVFSHFVIYATVAVRNTDNRGFGRLDGLFFGFIPVALLTFFGHALILPDMLGGGLLDSGSQSQGKEWSNPIWAIMEVVNALRTGFAGSFVAVLAAIVFLIGCLDFLGKKPVIVALLFIPTTLALLIMTSIGYTLFPRFFLFAMGFGVIIAMRGAAVAGGFLARVGGLPANWAKWLPMAVCAAIVAASALSLRYVYFPKQNYVAAIELIEAEKPEGETIITVGIADFPFNKYYGKGWANVKNIDELEALLPGLGRTWLVYTMPVHAKTAYPGIMQQIEQEYELVKQFFGTLNGGDVMIYRQKPLDAL